MAEDDERINMSADQKVDAELIRLAEEMADIFTARKALNERANKVYEKSDGLGITPAMLRLGVQWIRMMTKGQRGDAQRSLKRVLDVLGPKQRELFAEETAAQEKREAVKKKRQEDANKKAAEERTLKGVDPDTNPRSDPKKGGAGRRKAGAAPEAAAPPQTTTESIGAVAAQGENMIRDQIARNGNAAGPGDGSKADLGKGLAGGLAGEQEDGDKVFSDGLPQSQSAQAAAARNKAGVN